MFIVFPKAITSFMVIVFFYVISEVEKMPYIKLLAFQATCRLSIRNENIAELCIQVYPVFCITVGKLHSHSAFVIKPYEHGSVRYFTIKACSIF